MHRFILLFVLLALLVFANADDNKNSITEEEQNDGSSFVSCERGYEKRGCVKEGLTQMDLIVNDRMIINWHKFPQSIHSLACRCEAKARKEGYSYFSIRFWGECWAGKDKSAIVDVLKDGSRRSTTCAGGDFKSCDENSAGECVGTDGIEYVYTIEPRVDGGFSNWSEYTPCTKSCNGGTHIRSRTCTKPKPKYGGKKCQGPLGTGKGCNNFPCPVDGGLSKWTPFSSCDKVCGGGKQTRTRSCSKPTPANGGKKCSGPIEEIVECNVQPCPVDGGLSLWSNWNGCNKKCGGGNQRRSRSCTNPHPSNGGKNCVGSMNEVRRCNTQPCVCNNYRFLGRHRSCHSNVYTRQGGRCDGWARVGLEECKRRCNLNLAPGGCPSRPCKYVIWDTNPGTPPGWCQLATAGCRIGGANSGHHLFERGC